MTHLAPRPADSFRAAMVCIVAMGAAPLLAEDLTDPRIELGIAMEKQFCADQWAGLRIGPSAFHYIDLTGDGVDDLVVDERGLACDKPDIDPRMQGSAGARIVVVIDDKAFRFVAREWYVVERVKSYGREDGPADITLHLPHILLVSSGIACGGAGNEPCMTVLSWEPDGAHFNESVLSALE